MKSQYLIYLIFFFSLNNYLFTQFDDKYYDGPVNKCGTFKTLRQKETLQKHVGIDTNNRPLVGQKKYISSSGKFLLHFDTLGIHAVPLEDQNKNGIPDYIDSASYYIDKTYNLQVVQLGYMSPYPDDGIDGNEYDIYFADIGDGSKPNDPNFVDGGEYGSTTNTNSISNGGKFPQSNSYMLIDNNYSQTDSVRNVNSSIAMRAAYYETGILGLRITLAHEFQHAIQFCTGYSFPSNALIMEMCASAMEFRNVPESRDYLNWVRHVFKNLSNYPFGTNIADAGYGYSIFAKYFFEKYGQDKADKILKGIWDNVYSGLEVYSALDSSLKVESINLNQSLSELMNWMYYTGTRAKENVPSEPIKYFKDAKNLPEIKFYRDNKFISPEHSLMDSLLPYELRACRIIFPDTETKANDTLDVLMINQDLTSASSGSSTKRGYLLKIANIQINSDYKPLDSLGLDYYDYLSLDKIFTSFKANNGGAIIRLANVYPNPVNHAKDKFVFFPVPSNAIIGSKIATTVYNSEMIPITSESYLVAGIDHNNLIVNYDVNIHNLGNGVYFFSTEYKGEKVFGKFVVINK